jgi:hypothetical protein
MTTPEISNLYTNIPNTETFDTIKIVSHGVIKHYKKVYNLVNITVKQNYFKINDMWQQTDGMSMVSPISSILAEIFL